MKQLLINLSVRHPKRVFALTLGLVVMALLLMLRITIDTDPENMLPHSHPARVLHDEVKTQFNLHDMLVVGVVNEVHPSGIYNPQTLKNVHQLSKAIEAIDGVIVGDLMSLTTSDNITQAGEGAISFHWMMETPPASQDDAEQIRAWVHNLPMLHNTIVSADDRAAGIYIPITAKDQSYRIYNEIKEIIATLDVGDDAFHVTGLPVAEDTFGVEMFTQMAISAPAAAALIFVLMLFFFRSPPLVAAPMLIAMATVIITMGLMIGVGFPVHIMSSMIPIFLMPIAVVNSVHMLSDFSDHYREGMDKTQLVSDGINRLFRPMLFTSATSLVGFVSLNTADIPPVKVFGSFVGIGIGIAFLLTITFIPAYVVSLSDKTLAKMAARVHKGDDNASLMARVLRAMPARIIRYRLAILGAVLVTVVVSAVGISRIIINDNPINWFEKAHPIRVADDVLNSHFAGTYEAYLRFNHVAKDTMDIEKSSETALQGAPESVRQQWQSLSTQYNDKGKWDIAALQQEVLMLAFSADDADAPYWQALQAVVEKAGAGNFFLQPEPLAYIERLQAALAESGLVGKSMAVTDILKTVNRELRSGEAADYVLPSNAEAAAQAIMTFQSSHRPDYVWHMVTPDYDAAVIWLQLTSGDNQDMNKVIAYLDNWIADNPLPAEMEKNWSGLTYINVIWQDAMVSGMLASLASSFLIVMFMMIFLFRSISWGLIAMLPLTVTITLIYGMIGLVGKNYDMPVAVLSALTLGMSVDFAIHFIERSKLVSDPANWRTGLQQVFEEPGRAIARNAIVIALGFTPLLLAPLVPYQTVGFFMAAIMMISCLTTLVILPALVYAGRGWLFKDKTA